jgi:uncharacterized protein (TIGR02246 family)
MHYGLYGDPDRDRERFTRYVPTVKGTGEDSMFAKKSTHVHAYVSRVGQDRTALVSQLPHRFAWAWNRHDMDAAFADFEDDAVFVDVRGTWHSYEEIVNEHAALHRTVFANSTLAIDDVRLRLITIDSAYVHAEWTLTDAGSDAELVRRGTLIFVVARQGSAWRVFAAQSTGSL